MILLACLFFSLQDSAPEWSSFRGNLGAGHAVGSKLPAGLDPEDDLNWRVELPGGYSSPVVTGQHVLLTAAEGRSLLTLCLDRATGQEHWRHTESYDGVPVGKNSAAAPSPVTDGRVVYSLFHGAGLLAFDLGGELLWRRELGPLEIPHGLSASPLLAGEALVLLVDQDAGSYLIALDKHSGQELWKRPRPAARHGYSSAAIYTPATGTAQVLVSGTLAIESYSLADGSLLWSHLGGAWEPRALPVVAGDQCYVNLFIAPDDAASNRPRLSQDWAAELLLRDGDQSGRLERAEWRDSEGLQVMWSVFDRDADGALQQVEWEFLGSSLGSQSRLVAIDLKQAPGRELWQQDERRVLADNPSPLWVNGVLLMIKSGGTLSSLNALDGKLIKQRRVGSPAAYHASPVTDGERVLLASASGQLNLVSAEGNWQALGSSELNEEIWSTPAIAGGQVFVRTQSALWCLGKPE